MAAAGEIDHAEFGKVLARYDDLIKSLSKPLKDKNSTGLSTLAELDDWRLKELPTILAGRKNEKEGPYLLKEELENLMKWKLPQLSKLIASNADDTVKETTREAFKLHDDSSVDVKPAMSKLVQLKGVGPATASLVLSVYDQEKVPFFSDEAIRWLLFEDSKGKGWDRPLKYDIREFMHLLDKCSALRSRFEGAGHKVSANDVERAGYVLGKEAAGQGVTSKEPSKLQTGPEYEAEPATHDEETGQKRKMGSTPSTRRQKTKTEK